MPFVKQPNKPKSFPERVEEFVFRWLTVIVVGFIILCAAALIVLGFLIIFGVIHLDGVHYVVEIR